MAVRTSTGRHREDILSAERVERRLAAILAADVAGYSRLMGADEAGTLARLRTHRRELIDPKIAEHKGRIVKTTGDGLLIEFPSVVEAVACALAVQGAMALHNAATPQDRRIEFRIGINTGDVIVEDGDIHGDGVNVAARLEALAEPGGVCVSAIVHDQVRGRLDCVFDDIGEQSLKNIARPVRVYRVRVDRTATPAAGPVLALPDKPSIAVLPFENMSGDPEQEYFALRRRHGRGHHTRLVENPMVLRHRAQFGVCLQGPRRRREAGRPGTGCSLRAGRQRAQGR